MEEPTTETNEQLTSTQRRIYVASLSDYTDGRLHGEWIDADQDPEAIDDDIQEMLERSPMGRVEEWAIHDYEGFGAFQLSECESISAVSRIARGLAEHGPAFAHWGNLVGTADEDVLDAFGDYYRGVWSSMSAYAENLLDDLGIEQGALGPPWLQPYIRIDHESLGSDLSADLETAEDQDGVHLFEAR